VSDKEITLSCVLLTGSVDGTRRSMEDYLATFNKYQFLWSDDKSKEFKAFLQANPTLDDYEHQLSRFSELESQIEQIDQVYNLSCMALRAQSLKYSLKAEANAWKSQFAGRLHTRAKDQVCSPFSDIYEKSYDC
jgi:dynein heavy chain